MKLFHIFAASPFLVAACSGANPSGDLPTSPDAITGDPSRAPDESVVSTATAVEGSDPCTALAGATVAATGATGITLKWTPKPGLTIKIERETYCGADGYAEIGAVDGAVGSFEDKNVQANYVYWYRLTATDASGAKATLAIAAQAAIPSTPACGSNPGRASGVAAGSCSTQPAQPQGPTPQQTGQWGFSVGAKAGPAPSLPANVVTINAGDDIQQKIDAAPAGSTVRFSPGKYNASGVRFTSGKSFSGVGAELDTDKDGVRLQSSTTVYGFTFVGAGVTLDDKASNVTFTGNRVSATLGHAIWVGGELQSGSFLYNTFQDCHDECIAGYSPAHADFSFNHFNGNNADGIHFTWFGANKNRPFDVKISHNVFENGGHYSLEQQGSANGLDIGFNWFADYKSYTDDISIATGGDGNAPGSSAYNVNIHDNFFHSNPHGGAVIEAMGYSTVVSNNFFDIEGTGANFSITYWGFTIEDETPDTPATGWHDNTIVGTNISPGLYLGTENFAGENSHGKPTGQSPPAANVFDNAVHAPGSIALPTRPKIVE